MSAATTTLEAPAVEALTRSDRCDAACTAQAYVRVTLSAGAPLLFCGHHYRRYAAALTARPGVVVEDYTEDIPTGTPGASAFGH